MKTTKIILAILMLIIGVYLSVIGNTYLPVHTLPIVRSIILGASIIFFAKVTFMLIDRLFPEPSNLTLQEVKDFLRSKIFWAALLTFLATASKELLKVEIDSDTIQSVVNLDWSVTGYIQSLFSVVIIVLRKYDILKKLV